MRDFIFTMQMAGKSIISKISVFGDVITLYTRGSKQEHSFELSAAWYMVQTPPCTGNYSEIHFRAPIHTHLHNYASPVEGHHVHIQHCSIITPNIFKSFLQQLRSFQENPAAREGLYTNRHNQASIAQIREAKSVNANPPPGIELLTSLQKRIYHPAYMESFQYKDYNDRIDTTTPYMTPEDIVSAQNSYNAFYRSNQADLEAHYQQIQRDLTWTAEIRSNMYSAFLCSASSAFLHSVIKETFLAHGVSENKTQLLAPATYLAIISAFNYTSGTTSWYPLAVAAGLLAILKILQLSLQKCKVSSLNDAYILLASSVALSLTSLAQNLPMDGYSCISLVLSLIISIPTTIFISNLASNYTRNFWGKLYDQPQPKDDAAVAVTVTPKLHQN